MPSDGPTAFISYSRADSEFVLRMARDLKAAGAKVWLDQLDIEPGQRWARALQDAITNSPRFLVVLSPHSVDSTNVEDEVAFALEERKTIIPVLYCDCKVPFQLRPFQYADFRTDYAGGLRILLKTMGVEVPPGFTPSAAPVAETPKQMPVAEQVAEKSGQVLAAPKESGEKNLNKRMLAQLREQEVRIEQQRKATAEQRHKSDEEKARKEAEGKAAAEQARLDRERKVAEEQAQLEEERKAAEAKAKKDAEAKAAAEQVRLERERKTAAERARKEAAAKAAAAEEARLAAEETRKAKAAQGPSTVPAAVSIEPNTGRGRSLLKGIGSVLFASLLGFLGFLFLHTKRTAEPGLPEHAKEIQIKPRQQTNMTNLGEASRELLAPRSESTPATKGSAGVSTESTSTPVAGSAPLGAGKSLAMEQLLGEHMLGLQWIGWDKTFGKVTVTDKSGRLLIKGNQRQGTQYLTIDGVITSVEPRSFVFDGTIVTKVDSINKGLPCTRKGTMKFAATGARRYWRLQQMENPCDQETHYTDYVDIFMR